jgi:alpha-beta hydrolase superfamily lysophospholipase
VGWIAVLLGVYVLLLVGIAWFSLRPVRIPIYLSPGGMGLPQEEVEFMSQDGVRLTGWWVANENAQTVAIFAHGYMMNRCELVPEAFFLWQRGVACLLLDERMHGRSGGQFSTTGVKEALDVAAASAFVKSRMPGAKIVLIGSSMGSAASLLALTADLSVADALVLDSCYSRLPGAILGWWRFLGGPILSWLLSPTVLMAWAITGVNPFQIDLAYFLAGVKDKPMLFLHGSKDNLALPEEAQRNFAAASEPKTMVWFDRCGHSEGRWLQPDKYHEALIAFLIASGFALDQRPGTPT